MKLGIFAHAARYKKRSLRDCWRFIYLQFCAAENLPTSIYLNPQNEISVRRKQAFLWRVYLPGLFYMLYSLVDQGSQLILGMQGSGTLNFSDIL